MKRFGLKLLSACCLMLAYAQVFVVAGRWQLPEQALLWVLCPVLAALVATIAGSFPGRWRVVAGIAGFAGLAVCAFFLYPWREGFVLLISCALCYGWVFRASTAIPFLEWDMVEMLGGGVLYAVSMLLTRYMPFEGIDIRPVLRNLFLVYVPVFLLYVNHMSLVERASAHDGRIPPRRIRSGNRAMVIGISVVLLIAANLGALRDGFYVVWNWLMRVIGQVIQAFMSLFAPVATPDAGGTQQAVVEDIGALPLGETSLFWKIMEKVAEIAAIVIGAVLLIVLLVKGYQLLRKLAARIAERMRLAAAQLGEGVQESAESILDWEEVRDGARQRMEKLRNRLRRPPKWADMDNRQRVRWVFAQWKGKHAAGSAQTAREALAKDAEGAQMAAVYEKARYSDIDITDGEAAFMREAARRGE